MPGSYGTRGLLLIKYGRFRIDTICHWFKKPRVDFFSASHYFSHSLTCAYCRLHVIAETLYCFINGIALD